MYQAINIYVDANDTKHTNRMMSRKADYIGMCFIVIYTIITAKIKQKNLLRMLFN